MARRPSLCRPSRRYVFKRAAPPQALAAMPWSMADPPPPPSPLRKCGSSLMCETPLRHGMPPASPASALPPHPPPRQHFTPSCASRLHIPSPCTLPAPHSRSRPCPMRGITIAIKFTVAQRTHHVQALHLFHRKPGNSRRLRHYRHHSCITLKLLISVGHVDKSKGLFRVLPLNMTLVSRRLLRGSAA